VLKNFMTSGALSKGKKPEGDPCMAPFPRGEAVMSIYGRPIPHDSRHKLKLMCREVNAVSSATGVPLMV
jgi:hypothetical protein